MYKWCNKCCLDSVVGEDIERHRQTYTQDEYCLNIPMSRSLPLPSLLHFSNNLQFICPLLRLFAGHQVQSHTQGHQQIATVFETVIIAVRNCI